MNTNLTSFAPTMSSREIADLVELRHDNVKRTIENLAARRVIQLPQSEEVKNHLGQTVLEYRVGKRDSHVIVAQLSPEFTARLVDRWQELESKASAPMLDLSNPAVLRTALLSYTEKVIQLEETIERQAPDVEFSKAVRDIEGSIDMARMARLIGWGRNNLFEALRADKILMSNNLPYLHDAVGGNDYCNGKIAVQTVTDPCPNLKEVLHFDDFTEAAKLDEVFPKQT